MSIVAFVILLAVALALAWLALRGRNWRRSGTRAAGGSELLLYGDAGTHLDGGSEAGCGADGGGGCDGGGGGD